MTGDAFVFSPLHHMMFPCSAVARVEHIAFDRDPLYHVPRRRTHTSSFDTIVMLSAAKHLAAVSYLGPLQRRNGALHTLGKRDARRIAKVTPGCADIVGLRSAQDSRGIARHHRLFACQ